MAARERQAIGTAAMLFMLCSSALGSRLVQNRGLQELEQSCPTQNPQLAAWLQQEVQKGDSILPKQATDLETFLVELKTVLDKRMLPDRPIHYLLSGRAPFQLTCDGDWLEFGVFNAATLNLAATSKANRCGGHCAPVYGFDTFTGLPEEWSRGDGVNAAKGAFSLEGKLPDVASNVQLVRGIFADSLPLFEEEHARHAGNQTLSFLHIDCDLYAGTKDAFHHLNNRIRVGTVIVFDDLVNYNKYREGEVKALWEWLQATGAKLATLGMLGPLEGKTYAMDLNTNEPRGEHPWFQQSVAFVVAGNPRLEAAPPQHPRNPILLDAGAVKHAQVQVRSHQHSHGGVHHNGRERLARHEAANVEAYVPLKELQSDPEGDVPQDIGAATLSTAGTHQTELPADTIEAIG